MRLPCALCLLLGISHGVAATRLGTGPKPGFDPQDAVVLPVSRTSGPPPNGTTVLPVGSCAEVTENDGLNCRGEGMFVSGFRHSLVWQRMPGHAPLSNTICCKPDLPHFSLDASNNTGTPVAVISVGCHPSSGTSGSKGMCEGPSSYVAGWGAASAYNTLTGASYHYPNEPAECCTPALLMDDGAALEISRCGCADAADDSVSCPEGQLLIGYRSSRPDVRGGALPMAPAVCCTPCVSGVALDLDDCRAQGQCHGHGICVMGDCECHPGWAGSDCNTSARGGVGWVGLMWLVPGVAAMACCATLLANLWLRRALQLLRQYRGGGGESQDGEHLVPLLEVGEEGSVGSTDTSCSDDDEQLSMGREVERLMDPEVDTEAAATLSGEEAAAGAELALVQMPGGGGASEDGGGSAEGGEVAISGAASASEPDEAGGESRPPSGATTLPEVDIAPIRVHPEAHEAVDKDEEAKGSGSPGDISLCTVCFARPAQVVLVPCGHSNLCRRCSRRLLDCPFCRKPIARRQRMFLSS